MDDPAAQPLVLRTEHNGLAIELCVFDRDDGGNVYFDITGEDGTDYRIRLPDDTLTHPRSQIDDISIQTISPLAQYQIRAGVTQIGALGGPRQADVESQQALRQRYFAGIDGRELLPVIERIGSIA